MDRNRVSNQRRKTAGRIILIYSLFFAAMAGAVCLYFCLTGRTFVRGGDAFRQHLKAMIYYSRWLRSLFQNIFSGNFSLPTFSFSLGYGGDILTTFHHYGLGEPLCFFSVFVREEEMLWFYNALTVIRMYLAGLSFIFLVLYRKSLSPDEAIKDPGHFAFESTAGALTYVFCAYPVMFGFQHPHFLSAFILFPLILLGIEKMIREKKPVILVLSVFLAGLSSFYFLYMMAILAAAWYFLRRIPFEEGFRLTDFLREIFRILCYAILGLLMAGIVFIPVVSAFFQDVRSTSHTAFRFFYNLDYYRTFLEATLSSDYMGSAYGTLGFGALFAASVSMLVLRRRKYPKLCLALLLMTAGLLLPVFGYMMNGFSYVVNRWLFAFCLAAGLLVTAMIGEYRKAGIRDSLYALLMSAFYVGAAILIRMGATERFRVQVFFLCIFAVFVLTVALLRKKGIPEKRFLNKVPLYSLAALLIVSSSLLVNDYLYFRNSGDNNIGKFILEDGTTEGTVFWDNDAKLVSETADREFFRFTTEDPERNYENSSVLYGLSSTQFYWSMSNPYVSRYMTDLGVSDVLNLYDCYHGLDDRTTLMLLSGVRYDLTLEGGIIPYSYEKTETEGSGFTGLSVYRSDLALPFAYTFKKRMGEDRFYGLALPERQQVLTHYAVVEENASEEDTSETFGTELRSLGASLVGTKDLAAENYGLAVRENGAEMTLKLDESQDCETYIYVEGLQFAGQASADPNEREPSKIVIRFQFMSGDRLVSEKELVYRTAYDKWGKNQKDFLVNSGYHAETVDAVRIIFTEKGTYSGLTAMAYALDLSGLEADIAERTEDSVSAPDLHDSGMRNVTDEISFTVTFSEEKTVVTQVPYSDGWQVFLDGKQVKAERINIMFTGFSAGPGTHTVTLRYHTPGLSLGILSSLIGLAGSIVLLVLQKCLKKARD